MIWIALGIMIGTFAYVGYQLWQYYSTVDYSPSEADIANERHLMTLEKRHFGRYQLYHERQSKEYKQWLKETK